MMVQAARELGHHTFQLSWFTGSNVVGFERVPRQVEQLIMGSSRDVARHEVINHFPIILSVHRKIIAAMRAVGVVHEESIFSCRVVIARQQGAQITAIDRVAIWHLCFCNG